MCLIGVLNLPSRLNEYFLKQAHIPQQSMQLNFSTLLLEIYKKVALLGFLKGTFLLGQSSSGTSKNSIKGAGR